MTRTMEAQKMNGNLEMDDDTYKLRSRVMSFIYEAKEVVDLPRIDVRITEPTDGLRGEATLGGNTIWVGANHARDMTDRNLRTTVYHEILHAVLALEHEDGCPLLGNPSKPLPKSVADDLLEKYFRREG